jgi:hypothetical protein
MASKLNFFNTISESVKENSSLRDRNNAISTRLDSEKKLFSRDYSATNPPDKEAESRKNYRTYPYDYFSGIDAKVFFGDVWVDDIVTIQYTVNQSKIPIYGYASQLYDAVARGTVIVQGTLSISFKEMGYLNMVQHIIENQRHGAKQALESKVKELSKKAKEGKLQFIPNLEGSDDKHGNSLGLKGVGFSPNGNAQIIRQGQTIEDILMQKKGGNIVSSGLGAILYEEVNPNGNRDFEDFAEVLEDTIWGDSNGRPLGRKLKFRRPDEFDYTYSRKGDDLGGIQIGRDDYADALNILITFGDMNDFRAEHTVIALNDVHFTSQASIIAPTGEPIGETYTFFARDINQTLSSSTLNVPKIKMEIGEGTNPSALDDVDALSNYIARLSSAKKITIWSVANFNSVTGWTSIRTKVREVDFPDFNSYEPFIDQMIRLVERLINDTTDSQIDVSSGQHILEIEIEPVHTSIEDQGGRRSPNAVNEQPIHEATERFV